MVVGAEEKTSSVVGEFEFGPSSTFGTGCESVFLRSKVEGSERCFVEVSNIVEEDGGGGLRSNGHDICAWVVSCKVWRCYLELALWVAGCQVPETHCVVFAAGEELIISGGQGDTRYGVSVGGEIADK